MTNALLVDVTVGGVRIAAPVDVPRHVRGRAGDLWEWTGDGDALLSLLLARRRSNVPDAQGVAGHLQREVRQVQSELEEPHVEDLDEVFGDAIAAGAVVDGRDREIPVRHVLAAATDATEHVHVVHVVVRGTDDGHAVARQVIESLALEQGGQP